MSERAAATETAFASCASPLGTANLLEGVAGRRAAPTLHGGACARAARAPSRLGESAELDEHHDQRHGPRSLSLARSSCCKGSGEGRAPQSRQVRSVVSVFPRFSVLRRRADEAEKRKLERGRTKSAESSRCSPPSTSLRSAEPLALHSLSLGSRSSRRHLVQVQPERDAALDEVRLVELLVRLRAAREHVHGAGGSTVRSETARADDRQPQ